LVSRPFSLFRELIQGCFFPDTVVPPSSKETPRIPPLPFFPPSLRPLIDLDFLPRHRVTPFPIKKGESSCSFPFFSPLPLKIEGSFPLSFFCLKERGDGPPTHLGRNDFPPPFLEASFLSCYGGESFLFFPRLSHSPRRRLSLFFPLRLSGTAPTDVSFFFSPFSPDSGGKRLRPLLPFFFLLFRRKACEKP